MARHDDLTLNEILSDPMILLLARADGWSKAEFRDEMIWASQELKREPSDLNVPVARASPRNERPLEAACCAI
ncbi:hypothetical protein NOJ28_27945 [Neorhizobium galegae]|uniref:hypothetical protein n=1 Tax=Neorhizobium galegae TaxID=399 RepID=UPI0021048A23|nr:hypothetical protein [Neorhizobium galegae]MCQ1769363.1 hypothetical protein [Neorhizobium galegae]MCQ1848316.1 hypothetical protein [Neorhizobium galegae]